MTIQVYRYHASSYQDQSFIELEKNILSSIAGVRYLSHLAEIDSDQELVLITNTHVDLHKIESFILEQTSFILHPNSGYDNLDLDLLDQYGIIAIKGNMIRRDAVIQYIVSSFFHHYVPIKNFHYWPEQRSFDRPLLRNLKAVIIGLGHIGQKLHQILSALSVKTYGFDPHLSHEHLKQMGLEQLIFSDYDDELLMNHLRTTDCLILCHSHLKNTPFQLGQKHLIEMKEDLCLINASRGSNLDEDALVQFLSKNEKACAYLDVFGQEPFSPGHHTEVTNLIKTPHIAGISKTLNADIIDFEKQILLLRTQVKDLEEFKRKAQEHLL